MSSSNVTRGGNCHRSSTVWLGLLLGISAFTHFLAIVRMDMTDRQFAIMDDRTIRQMGLIDFVQANHWITIGYAAFFLACLMWLEIRKAPRWTVWVTFFALALPCLVYIEVCARIGNKFILWADS